MNRRAVFVLSVLSFFTLHLVDTLQCYQCADSRVGGPCQEDTAGMLETHKAINDTSNDCTDMDKCGYFKNCSNGQNYCVIERLEEQGQIHAFLRECGPPTLNKNLSFFPGITPTNYTSCVIYGEKMIYCVTLCETDMCNGPQKPDTSDGTSCSVMTNAHALMLFSISIITKNFFMTS